MKILKANAVYLDTNEMSPYQVIEKAGRTCYKSEENITDDSAITFVKKMLKSGHTAMLEHGTIYLRVPAERGKHIISAVNAYRTSASKDNTTAYLNITNVFGAYYISGSFRTFINLFNMYFNTDTAIRSDGMDALYKALVEQHDALFEAKDLSIEMGEKIYVFSNASDFIADVYDMVYEPSLRESILKKHVVHTVVFTCDRGVSHEFVRHRPCGFAQESTRYCNYSKDKFGNEISVIAPLFFEEGSDKWDVWKATCEHSETMYFKLLEMGATPQEARSVLPNSLKTEIVITAPEMQWQHIVNLRWFGTTGKPHPQMVECMGIAFPQLNKASNGRICDER